MDINITPTGRVCLVNIEERRIVLYLNTEHACTQKEDKIIHLICFFNHPLSIYYQSPKGMIIHTN